MSEDKNFNFKARIRKYYVHQTNFLPSFNIDQITKTMKFIKIILIIILIPVVAWLIICAVAPSKMEFEVSKEMAVEPAVVFKEISDFRNWEAWNPWAAMDSTTVNSYSGPKSGLGTRMDWTGDLLGSGSQEIIEETKNEFVKVRLLFNDFPGENFANWKLEKVAGGTNVTWTFDGGEIPFLFRGFSVLFGKESLVENYNSGLNGLKAVVEAKPVMEPTVETISDTWYIGVSMDNITEADLSGGNVHGPAFGKIMEFLAGEGVDASGMPITIVRRHSEESMDLTFAIPVADSIAGSSELIVSKIPGGKAMSTIHYGSYESSGETWYAIGDYIEGNGVAVRYFPYEIYLNDPDSVAESEIMTKIVFPVAD